MTVIHGIDVASYQGPHPDLSGCDFECIKITQGVDYVSPDWPTQLADARAAGLVVLHSHFPEASESFAAQAEFLRATLGAALLAGDIIQLDWEMDPANGTSLSGTQKDEFLAALKAAFPGHKVVLYCNLDYWRNVDTTSDCGDGLWIADPNSPPGQPAVQHPWLIHQYDISGDVDQDVADFPDRAAMAAWANPAPTSPPPEVDMTPEQAAQLTDVDNRVKALETAVKALPALVWTAPIPDPPEAHAKPGTHWSAAAYLAHATDLALVQQDVAAIKTTLAELAAAVGKLLPPAAA